MPTLVSAYNASPASHLAASLASVLPECHCGVTNRLQFPIDFPLNIAFTFVSHAPPITLEHMNLRFFAINHHKPAVYRATLALAGAAVAGALLTACDPDKEQTSLQLTSPSESSQTTPGSASMLKDTASQPSEPLCTTDQLKMEIGQRTAGAGSIFLTLTFTNTGTSTCTFQGFPGVSLVTDKNGTQLGRSATREKNIPFEPVTLKPNALAHSTVRVNSTGPLNPDECRPEAADGLRIYPPDQTTAAYIPTEGLQGCSGDTAILSVQPVMPGSGSEGIAAQQPNGAGNTPNGSPEEKPR